WSPDATYLTFCTRQRTEPGQVVRIDLVPRTPKFHEDQFRDLFKEETPKTPTEAPRPAPGEAPKPESATKAEPAPKSEPLAKIEAAKKRVDIVFDEIRRRASVLPVGVDVNQQSISPDGKWLLLTASAAGQENLYVYPLDELSKEPAVARQLTSAPGSKRRPQFTHDSKEDVYLDWGRGFSVTLENREP